MPDYSSTAEDAELAETQPIAAQDDVRRPSAPGRRRAFTWRVKTACARNSLYCNNLCELCPLRGEQSAVIGKPGPKPGKRRGNCVCCPVRRELRARRTGGTRNCIDGEHARPAWSKLGKRGFFAKSRGQPTPDAPPARPTPHRRAKSCSLLPFFRCRSHERPLGRVWTPPAGDRPANPRFAPASASKRPPARLTGVPFTGRSTVKRAPNRKTSPRTCPDTPGRRSPRKKPFRARLGIVFHIVQVDFHFVEAGSRQRPAFGYGLPATGHMLPGTGQGLPATGYRPPATCYRLPATGHRAPSVIVIVIGRFPSRSSSSSSSSSSSAVSPPPRPRAPAPTGLVPVER